MMGEANNGPDSQYRVSPPNEPEHPFSQSPAEEALRLDESRLEALLRLDQMSEASLQEITGFALEEAVRLTKSKIGYLAFMSEDESVLTMHSWSKTAMTECAIIDKPIVYPVQTTGLWGEAVRQRKPVITNDYAAPSSLKKGYPQGHVPVLRHMNVPVFEGKRIVVVAGVGNKEEPYDESDVRQLTLLMRGMWKLIRRKQIEDALRDSEVRLRQIIDLVPHLIFAKDRQGRFILANRAIAEAYGTTVEGIVGTTDADHHPPGAEVNHFRENDLEVIDGGLMKFIPEETMVDAQGNRRVLQTTKIPYTTARSTEQAVLGVAVDVTELKRAEEELRKAHDELELRVQQRTAALEQERYLLHALMDNLPHSIYFKDAASRFVRINRALAGYFGLRDSSDAISKTDFDFFTEEHARQALEDEQEIIRFGRPLVDKEEKETWPNGHATWVLSTKMPLYDAQGRIVAPSASPATSPSRNRQPKRSGRPKKRPKRPAAQKATSWPT